MSDKKANYTCALLYIAFNTNVTPVASQSLYEDLQNTISKYLQDVDINYTYF